MSYIQVDGARIMSEHDTQNAILDLIQFRGGVATRVNSGSAIFKRDGVVNVIKGAEKGTADIIAGIPRGGQLIYAAIEVKHGKNKLTFEQAAFLENVRSLGGIGIVAYSVDDVAELFD